MAIAEFEEREYERPLYHELRVQQNRLWSPGQVLEAKVGFDTALFLDGPFPLSVYSPALYSGVIPSRHWRFFRRELGVPARRKLPNFSLNLFIQAKRPRRISRVGRALRNAGMAEAHWAFEIEGEQQSTLEKLEASLNSKAIVTYASPVFHTEQSLYAHTEGGTIAETSTFPSPSVLSGHDNWHYRVPGAIGIAASEPVSVVGTPLSKRLAEISGAGDDGPPPPARQGDAGDDDGDWRRHLALLDSALREIVGVSDAAAQSVSSRRARYFSLIREIEADAAAFELPDWMKQYQRIEAFSHAYHVAWLCVA